MFRGGFLVVMLMMFLSQTCEAVCLPCSRAGTATKGRPQELVLGTPGSRIEAHSRVLLRETVGPVEAIREISMSELLRRRIEEARRLGLLTKAQEKTRERFAALARVPVALKLPRATETRTWRFPLMRESDFARVPEALYETLLKESRRYAFFDASDAAQIAWASRVRDEGAVKLILTGGERNEAEKRLGVRLYADQGAVLTRRFGVKALPTLVEINAREGRGTSFYLKEEP